VTGEKLYEAIGELNAEAILDAGSVQGVHKRPYLKWISAAACLCLLAAGILCYRLEYPYPIVKKIITLGPEQELVAEIPHWEEMEIYQQYGELMWEEVSYRARSGVVSEERIGGELARVTGQGWDHYAELEGKEPLRTLKATLYEIRGISGECAVAVRYDGTELYYAAVNSYYRPETLGQFAEDLNLQENLVFNRAFYEYRKPISGRYASVRFEEIDNSRVWEMLHANPDAVNEYDQLLLHQIPQKILGISVSIPLLGYENISLSILEDGYIKTNILDTGKLFCIGEETTQAFLTYVLEECEGYETVWSLEEPMPEEGGKDRDAGASDVSRAQEPVESMEAGGVSE